MSPHLSVHGAILCVVAAVAAATVTWARVPQTVDPRQLLGWLVGLATLAFGFTWMWGV